MFRNQNRSASFGSPRFQRSGSSNLDYSQLEGRKLLAGDVTPDIEVNSFTDLSADSNPFYIGELDGDTLFRARSQFGSDPWRTDGTPEGTVRIESDAPEINSTNRVTIGDITYFTHSGGRTGLELWRTDGTEAGTYVVKDILNTSSSSSPQNLTVVDELIFFSAYGGRAEGRELWVSDGTEAGTLRVKDINPGSDYSDIRNLSAHDGKLLFSANDGVHGRELWVSDGTEVGTFLLADLNAGTDSSNPSLAVSFDGTAYFSADDGFHSNGAKRLWSTDGTVAGTQNALEFTPVGDEFVVAGDRLFFHQVGVAAANGSGYSTLDEFGSIDTNGDLGTPIEINPGAGDGSFPTDFFEQNGIIYFAADDGTTGREFWRSDGTAAGTWQVADIAAGAADSTPRSIAITNGNILIAADDGISGNELWISDGTTVSLLKEINFEAGDSTPRRLTVVDDSVFFHANDGVNGSELYVADSTLSNASLVLDINTNGSAFDSPSHRYSELVEFDGQLFFTTTGTGSSSDVVLAVSDGTVGGTYAFATDLVSRPIGLFVHNDLLYFSASSSTGWNTWVSDGTVQGTELLLDSNGDTIDGFTPDDFRWAPFHKPVVVDGDLYFFAQTSTFSFSLFRHTTGSGFAENLGAEAFGYTLNERFTDHGSQLFAFEDELYFWDWDPVDGKGLNKFSPDTGLETRVMDLNWDRQIEYNRFPETAVTEAGIFIANVGIIEPTHRGIWFSDGTTEGTQHVLDQYFVTDIVAVGDRAFFAGNGRELWTSDGTTAGTYMVSDINPGDDASFQFDYNLTVVGERAFFIASDGVEQALWAVDEFENLQKLKSIGNNVPIPFVYGPGTGDFVHFVDTGSALVFTGMTLTHGEELYTLHYPTSVSLDAATIFENDEVCAPVGSLSTTDLDSDQHTFALVEGEGDEHNHLFDIIDGEIKTLGALDYEQNSSATIRVRATDPEGFYHEEILTIEVQNVPELTAQPIVGDGTSQRSRVDQLTLVVDADDLTIANDAFTLVDRATMSPIPVSFATSVNGNGHTEIELSYSGAMTRASGALLDGFYQLTVDASKIMAGSVALDLDGDISTSDTLEFGNEEADNFFAFFGDSNGDNNLNIFDLLQFRQTYGLEPGDAGYNAAMDFDTAGVGIFDLLQFRTRYGTDLQWT